jgi:hypothetical protein
MTNPHPGINKPFDVSEHVTAEHGHMDMREHMKAWHGFMQLVKWGIIGNIAILVFLAIFRTH